MGKKELKATEFLSYIVSYRGAPLLKRGINHVPTFVDFSTSTAPQIQDSMICAGLPEGG